MADKPIIFSAPMVRALLAGRKTQTRRLLRPQPEPFDALFSEAGRWWTGDAETGDVHQSGRIPYAPGDRLYVREAFQGHKAYEAHGYPPRDWGNKPIWYCADGDAPPAHNASNRKRPSIHMPRWASRITLTATEVRVQRLQDISEADAWAEGCKPGVLNDRGEPFPAEEPAPDGKGEIGWDCARDWYADLWDSLHGPDAWDANPWVAAYTFTVQRGNIDEMQP